MYVKLIERFGTHVVAERLTLALELLDTHVTGRLLREQLLLGCQQTIQFTLQCLQFLLQLSASLKKKNQNSKKKKKIAVSTRKSGKTAEKRDGRAGSSGD